MEKLPEQTLTAIGRMTVAAVELESVLAGMTTGDTFAEVGGALRAARAAVAGRDDEQAKLVEAAATQLAVSHAAVRAMWRGGRTDAALFDEITTLLLGCADRLQLDVQAAAG